MPQFVAVLVLYCVSCVRSLSLGSSDGSTSSDSDKDDSSVENRRRVKLSVVQGSVDGSDSDSDIVSRRKAPSKFKFNKGYHVVRDAQEANDIDSSKEQYRV